jgi:type IV secretion system protein VirD4
MPFAELMSRSKLRASMVITDPKKEIYYKTASTFRDQGYNIKVIDFTDFKNTDRWNPFTPIFRHYRKFIGVRKSVTVKEIDGVLYNEFNGKIYKNQEELDFAINTEESIHSSEVDSRIDAITSLMCTTEDSEKNEWSEGAKTIFKAIMYGMLEDSDPNDRKFPLITEDTFSIDTLITIFDSFEGSGESCDNGYFDDRDHSTSKAYSLASSTLLINAKVTSSGYISVLASYISKYRDAAIRQITCANSFSFEDFDDGKDPTVIYIIFKDETSTYDTLIGLFLAELYRALVDMIRKKDENRKNPFYFLLDEFGNLPAFPDFDRVTSLGRARNIWFWVIIQSYAQLDEVYKNKATTIKNNLTTHIFLGTNDYDTKESFSKECGMHTIISSSSVLFGTDRTIRSFDKETVSLIPVSHLSQLPQSECIITGMNISAVWSRFERHYTCPEFNTERAPYVHNATIALGDPKYKYRLKKNKKRNPFDFDFN